MNDSMLSLPGSAPSVVEPANGKHFSLEELQRMVGGYIEIVYEDDTGLVIVNEDGRAKNLPPNHFAWSVLKGLFPYEVVVLFGPVVFAKRSHIAKDEE